MSRRVAFYGIFAALAVLMGYVEAMVPAPVPIPGIKLGLANVIVLISMYFISNKAALGVNVIRVVMSALLFNGFSGFLFSIAGAGISYIVMVLAKRIKSSSIIGVSVLGGVTHNIAQIGVAAIVLDTPGLMYYVPVILISGIITGVIIGIVSKYCLKHIEKAGLKY